MAKYGRKAQSKVKRAMQERKHGTLRSGRSGKRVTSRKTGDRDWLVGSAQVWREGPAQTILETVLEQVTLVTTITRVALTDGLTSS